jgi:hypothetical protein
MERSEAAKKAGTKDVNFSVAPGRSGMSAKSIKPFPGQIKGSKVQRFGIPG